ncbi:hypothetical protein LC040_06000 [Bacillus tianshenii]|nr:hypothetical protein LC040_06000 [Bacillus tianshenii]
MTLLGTAIQEVGNSELKIKEFITLVGIILTFVVGLINIFVTLKNNSRSLYVNAITSERVKWMGQLKELVSEYLSMTTVYDDKPTLEGKEFADYIERLIYLQNRIKLHLNYTDPKDEEINDLISKINNKITGLYEMKNLLNLSDEEKRKELISPKFKKYFEEVAEETIGVEEAKRYFMGEQQLGVDFINNVIKKINEDIKKKYGYEGKRDLDNHLNDLVEKSRVYLKEEWEKVKKEANKGRLKK